MAIPMKYSRYYDTTDLTEEADFANAGLPLVAQNNENKWKLGDIAQAYIEQVSDDLTVTDLARAWDVDTPRVSEWRNVASFYPRNVRTYELSWSHYNLARRKSADSLDNALELLDMAERLNMHYRAFKRYCNGEYYEGTIHRSLLPGQVQSLIPDSVTDVWIIVRKTGA